MHPVEFDSLHGTDRTSGRSRGQASQCLGPPPPP
jgi:hypothetical protein